MLGVPGGLLEERFRYLGEVQRAALTETGVRTIGRLRILGIALLKRVRERHLRRIWVSYSETTQLSRLVEQVERTPVGENRHRLVHHRRESLLVVQRRCEGVTDTEEKTK